MEDKLIKELIDTVNKYYGNGKEVKIERDNNGVVRATVFIDKEKTDKVDEKEHRTLTREMSMKGMKETIREAESFLEVAYNVGKDQDFPKTMKKFIDSVIDDIKTGKDEAKIAIPGLFLILVVMLNFSETKGYGEELSLYTVKSLISIA